MTADAAEMKLPPYETVVEVLVDGRWFPAALAHNNSMNSDGEVCDQWYATTEDHPPCWSGGGCWEVNADECCSAQPEAWRYIV